MFKEVFRSSNETEIERIKCGLEDIGINLILKIHHDHTCDKQAVENLPTTIISVPEDKYKLACLIIEDILDIDEISNEEDSHDLESIKGKSLLYSFLSFLIVPIFYNIKCLKVIKEKDRTFFILSIVLSLVFSLGAISLICCDAFVRGIFFFFVGVFLVFKSLIDIYRNIKRRIIKKVFLNLVAILFAASITLWGFYEHVIIDSVNELRNKNLLHTRTANEDIFLQEPLPTQSIIDEYVFTMVIEGNLEAVSEWVENNDINIKDSRGLNLLYYAVINDHVEIASILLESGIRNPHNPTDGQLDFSSFIFVNSVEMAELFVRNNSDANSRRWMIQNALHHVQSVDLINYLLQLGADPNQPDRFGATPLLSNVRRLRKNLLLLEALLVYGADPNIVDVYGRSALLVACQIEESSFAELLLKYGADPNILNEEGQSALLIACLRGNLNLVKLLLENGANINHQDFNKGWTPFLAACKNGHLDLVELLWLEGADIDVELNDGRNAQDIADSRIDEVVSTFLFLINS